MQLQTLSLDALTNHADNYNRHPDDQIAELMKSLDQFGQFKNIVVCQGRILAGHGLVEAARRRGDSHIAALVRDDLTETQQRALLLADNATPAGALPDIIALQALIDSMGEIDVPGVTDDWLREMCGEPDSRPLLTLLEDDDSPDDAATDAGQPAADQAAFPLAVVLTRAQYEQWQQVKAALHCKTDTQAVVALMGRV